MSTPTQSLPEQHHEQRHPTFMQYVTIAIVLFVITIVEFLIILPEDWQGQAWTLAPLIILSCIKFAIVIMFYMHLKFDNQLFSWIFLAGLGLGLAVVIAVLGLFFALNGAPRAYAVVNAVPYVHGEKHVEPETAELPSTETPTDAAQTTTGSGDTGSGSTESSGGATAPSGAVSAAVGQEVFMGVGTCATCHLIQGLAPGGVGPELTHIGTEAATRQPGVSAADYIEDSIRNPEAFVATDVANALPGLMTQVLIDSLALTDEQIDSLVEFLLAQE